MAEKPKKQIKKRADDASSKKSGAKVTAKKTVATKTAVEKSDGVIAILDTTMGVIEIELYPDKAPVTVRNFLDYAKSGYYDGLTFHRVIPNFMIQGGGFDDCMAQKETKAPIKIESDNGLKNERGSIAMARTNDPQSATSQFFINVADNSFLNFREASIEGYGYAVFGKVIKGMDAVDKIATVETGRYEYFTDVPKEFIIIKNVTVK